MAFKMKYKNLKAVVEELRGAVKAHGKQADTIEKHIDDMGDSPMKRCWDGFKPNPDGRAAKEKGSCVPE